GGGGFGGGGGGNGSGFFLISLLLFGHGLGFGVLLALLLAYALFSRFGTGMTGGGSRGYAPPPMPQEPLPRGGAQNSSGMPPGAYGPRNAAEATAYAAGSYAPAGAGGYDDTHPIGVPERFRGATLEGSHPAAASGAGASVEEGLAAITAHDPAFDAAAFVSQAQSSFFIIQEAWSQGKPEMSRSVMADGLAQQFAFQMDEYTRKGQRNLLDGLTVAHADVVAAHSDQSFDTLTVRFQAASADYDVDVRSGRVTRGHRDLEPWTEDWIFQRSAQATTRPGEGTMNRRCPNCGAPISISPEGTCEYCHAQVMSGKYDWVLARIDQVQAAYSQPY
ncbi:MAG TPA: Tim44-like domain-containing protein, partial [Candidatus Dormibacteraeota bacterium]